ncbi:MotA/TolQ/ExbB proton channel family protein [Paraburkholderia humisilvae]|uniref:Tol-Pal system protein TolQ n=1 Tax=Paraburkholderia humisilvae TaxID=627669 RepID=A0A6J5F5V1_9BURK|nr:MotA/TolQ/ExbB proton channel family protein [Paraburkholderia humisilvae]CAB3772546.1 Tol-Pal system protein TolQ [Paraburkholderia humisilvae]
MNITQFTHLASDSGGVLYVIVFMLFVALTVIIERLSFLHRATGSTRMALKQIDAVDTLDASKLVTCAAKFSGQPAERVLTAAAHLAGRASREDLDSSLEETVMREAPRVDRFLWVLDTVVTLAPLLGLFGTIVGMFNAFQVLSNPGNAPTQVTGGVAEALVATASGLFVAMFGLVFFNALQNRVRTLMHQLETLKAALVNRLAGVPREALKDVREMREAPAAGIAGLAVQRGG